MGYVTNVVVSARYVCKEDKKRLEEIGFANIGDHAGGPKHYEADTFARTYNYGSFDAILQAISMCLEYVNGCVVIFHDESDSEVSDDHVHVWHVSAWGEKPTFTQILPLQP